MTDQEAEYLWQRRYDIKVRALTNRIYYQERQRVFERREGIVKAASILAGSVAFANIADQEIVRWCAVAVTVASTASLVFGYGSKARDSAKRSAEWALLERDIEVAGERTFTEAQLGTWSARANEIEAGEPAAHALLFRKCHERAVAALGGTLEQHMNWFQRLLPPVLIP
jgi:hypothetical protein